MLPVSLDFPFLIASPVFSNDYLSSNVAHRPFESFSHTNLQNCSPEQNYNLQGRFYRGEIQMKLISHGLLGVGIYLSIKKNPLGKQHVLLITSHLGITFYIPKEIRTTLIPRSRGYRRE